MSNIIYIPKPKPLFTPVEYGALYNWYAATDSRNIAASGWHVSSQSEWTTLLTYLGGYEVAGGKLKENSLTYWYSPNRGASNTSKFNGRGGGQRTYDGAFNSLMSFGYHWYANSLNTRDLTSSSAYLVGSPWDAQTGNSVRLVKDSTTLTNGQTGTYTGNDGKIYRTVCIGTQEWIADNLCETKYRNGDLIPEVTNATTWSDLTTGALCAYNNDWNNV